MSGADRVSRESFKREAVDRVRSSGRSVGAGLAAEVAQLRRQRLRVERAFVK